MRERNSCFQIIIKVMGFVSRTKIIVA